MAANHTSTGATYSNLTRRELEQLRKADFTAGGKALSIGDESNSGSINDERFYTGPTVALTDVWAVKPPAVPVPFLLTSAQPSNFVAESVRWYGPKFIFSSYYGWASGPLTWRDLDVATDLSNVQAGDILLVKSIGDAVDDNTYATGIISSVTQIAGGTFSGWEITLSSVKAPNHSGSLTSLAIGTSATPATYTIIRQHAVQLFALPGSGPLGREQTFVAVKPDSALHLSSSPTLDEINVERIRDLVPPSFAANESVDRADGLYPAPAGPGNSLDLVGYRPVLYRSLPDGSGPDWTSPLPQNPRIDGSIPDADQRMTVDYKAGFFRFSTPPLAGNDVKPTGGNLGVNATTGRLQLWAVYWAVDSTLTAGASSSVYYSRSTETEYKSPARVFYESYTPQGHFSNVWRIGATSESTDFVVRTFDVRESGWRGDAEDVESKTDFGVFPPQASFSAVEDPFRGFRIRSDGKIRMIQSQPANEYRLNETGIEEKTKITVGLTGHSAGDYPIPSSNSVLAGDYIGDALKNALTEGEYATVFLRRGVYRNTTTTYIPPGITLEGEGYGTVIDNYMGSLKVGPNTSWGVYDPTHSNGTVTPAGFITPLDSEVLGYDVVWNQTRRVWAIFIAEKETNSIWFNEVSLDGSRAFPGLGINVKRSTGTFFTLSSNSTATYLTEGHYPRATHHPYNDEYSFVWTEEYIHSSLPGVVGPRSFFTTLCYTNTNPSLKFADRFTFKRGTDTPIVGVNFTCHPSIAADITRSLTSEYQLGIAVASFADPTGAAGSRSYIASYNSQTGILLTGNHYNDGYTGYSQVSSTDIVAVPGNDSTKAKFVCAWSQRNHRVIMYTTGVITNNTLTDPTNVPNWGNVGVAAGDRFLLLRNQTGGVPDSTKSGLTGVVTQASSTALYYQMEGAEGSEAINNIPSGTGFSYAIIPTVRVFARSLSDESYPGHLTVAGPSTVSSSQYLIQEREPDFVRLSYGAQDRILLAYQNFDTRASLSIPIAANFDDGVDSTLSGSAGYKQWSATPQRFHLSTSFVIIAASGSMSEVAPSKTTGTESSELGSTLTAIRRANDLEVIRRSLGSRDPLVPYANTHGNSVRPYLSISPRCHSLPIRSGVIPPFIPDATWNGQDWVVISPTVGCIWSDTGRVDAYDPIAILTDPTFLFSDGYARSDGYIHRKTVRPESDYIVFPTLNTRSLITGVVDEHTITIERGSIGAGIHENLEWYLEKNDVIAGSGSDLGSPKTPGFRVGIDGTVIQSSSYTTFSPELTTGDDPTRREVLQRGNPFGNTVFQKTRADVVATSNLPLGRIGIGFTIDGVTLTEGTKVLATAQSAGISNGLYLAYSGGWVRSSELASGAHAGGTAIYIKSGSTYSNQTWSVLSSAPNDVVDTDDLVIYPYGIGDLLNYSTEKFGMPGMVYNDLLEGARLKGDIGFNGVAVGSHRPLNNKIKNNYVALSWGENLFGYIDQDWVKGTLEDPGYSTVRLFRQSFGPYNVKIRNLTVRNKVPKTGIIEGGLYQIKSKNHIYTRHGGAGCSNPFFATDGYRNVFMHLGVWSYGQSWESGTLAPPTLVNRDPRTSEGYNVSICAVFTDILGKQALRKRVITFPSINRTQTRRTYQSTLGIPDWQRDYLIGSLPRDFTTTGYSYSSGNQRPSYGARAIWTGKTFLGLVIVPRGLLLVDLGASAEDPIINDAVVGCAVARDADTYKTWDLGKITGFTYINSADGMPKGPLANVSKYGENCIADTRALDIVDGINVDTCYADGVLAVVWVAGQQQTFNSGVERGASTLGITFFRSGQGDVDNSGGVGRAGASFNSTTHLIDTHYNSGYIRDPKITWNGNGYTITYIYRDSSDKLKTFSLPKDGLQGRSVISSVSGQTTYEAADSGISPALGTIDEHGRLQLRTGSKKARVGDIVLITRVGTDSSVSPDDVANNDRNFGSSVQSDLNGAYTIKAINYASNIADLGVNLKQTGVFTNQTLVHGMIISGDGVASTELGADSTQRYTTPSGVTLSGSFLKPTHGLPSSFGAGSSISVLWGSFYLEKQDKFVVFYSRSDLTYPSGKLVIASYTRDGTLLAEVHPFFNGSAEGPRHVAVAWNGNQFLMTTVSTLGTYIYSWVVSPDLGLTEQPSIYYDSLIGNGSGAVAPGPGYGPPSFGVNPPCAIRATNPVWNTKSCQWMISVSVGWFSDTSIIRPRYNSLDLVTSVGVLFGITSNVINFSWGTSVRQPGLRYLATQYTTVVSGGSSRNLTPVDPPAYGDDSWFFNPSVDKLETSFSTRILTGNRCYLDGMSYGSSPDTYSEVRPGDLVTIGLGDDTGLLTATKTGIRYTWQGIGSVDYIALDGGIYSSSSYISGATGVEVKRVAKDFIFQCVSSPSSSSLKISTNISQCTNTPSSFNSYVLYAIPREDVYLITLADPYPLVEVTDADGVQFEDVRFEGGLSDVSETYPRMSKPFWKVGGVNMGLISSTLSTCRFGQREHVAPITPSPLRTVETVTFTNVRSNTIGRHGYDPIEASKKGS